MDENIKVKPFYLTVFLFFFLDKLGSKIRAVLQLSSLTIADCMLSSSNAPLHTTITHNLFHPHKALALYGRNKTKEIELKQEKKETKLSCAILTLRMPYQNPLSIPQSCSAQQSPHYYLHRQQNTQLEDPGISPSPARPLRLSYLSLPLPLARVLGA